MSESYDDLDDRIVEKCTELTNLFIDKLNSADSIDEKLNYLSGCITRVYLTSIENSGFATLRNLVIIFEKLFLHTLQSMINLKNSGEERGKVITLEKLNKFKECVIMSYQSQEIIESKMH